MKNEYTHMCIYAYIYIPSYHKAASRIQVCTPDLDQKPFMIDVQDIPGGAAGSGKVTYLSLSHAHSPRLGRRAMPQRFLGNAISAIG